MCNKMKTEITIGSIVSDRGISPHGPTITSLLLTTRHVGELRHKLCKWHQYNSFVIAPSQNLLFQCSFREAMEGNFRYD